MQPGNERENSMRKRSSLPSKIWNYSEPFANRILHFFSEDPCHVEVWEIYPLGLFWWGHYFWSDTNYFCSFWLFVLCIGKNCCESFFSLGSASALSGVDSGSRNIMCHVQTSHSLTSYCPNSSPLCPSLL